MDNGPLYSNVSRTLHTHFGKDAKIIAMNPSSGEAPHVDFTYATGRNEKSGTREELQASLENKYGPGNVIVHPLAEYGQNNELTLIGTLQELNIEARGGKRAVQKRIVDKHVTTGSGKPVDIATLSRQRRSGHGGIG